MSGVNPLSVGGTNLLGGGLLQDPRMGIVNSLMSSGMENTPVRSGWQEAARAVQGIVGALMYNKVQGENADALQGLEGYMKADPATQAHMAAANPRLAQMAGLMGLQTSLIGQKARIEAEARQFEPYNLEPGVTRMGPSGPIASGPSVWQNLPNAGAGAPSAPSAAATPPAVATSPLGPDGTQRQALAENPTGNPAAQNPNSSAAGDGQFIDKTWLEQFKKLYPDQAKGMGDAQILALRTDPKAGPTLSRNLIASYAQDNAKYLSGKGIPDVGAGELSLAHFAGPEGAYKILSADPATPVEKLLSPDAMTANPFLAGKTAGQLRQWATSRVAAPSGAQAAAASPGAPEPRYAQAFNSKTGNVVQFAVDASGKPLTGPNGGPVFYTKAPDGQRWTTGGTLEPDPVAARAAGAKVEAETPPTVARATQMIPVNAAQASATRIAEGEAALSPPPADAPTVPGAPATLAGQQSATTTAGAKAAENAAIPSQPMTHEQTIAAQARAHDQFMNNPQVKEHYEVAKNFQSVIDSARGTDKASDINLIDGLVKMFNPGATVRQSTFENFMEHSQGLPSNVVGMVQAWYSNNQHLQPETRQQLVDQAQIRMLSSRQSYDQFSQAEAQTATKSGLDPTTVVPKFEDPLQKMEREKAAKGTAAPRSTRSTSSAPPADAIAHLKSNPGLASSFDEWYGPGSAARALGK